METAQILLDAMTYADEDGEEPYFHNELIWADDTPVGKQQMAVYRREFGMRIRLARKARMRKLSYERLAGLREIVIDPMRARRHTRNSRSKSIFETLMEHGRTRFLTVTTIPSMLFAMR